MNKQEYKERLEKLQEDFKKKVEDLEEKVQRSFGKLSDLQDFANLIIFELTIPEVEEYSLGFEILWDESIRKDCVKNWLRNSGKPKRNTKDFFDRLMPFADANGTGSFYCVWVDDNNKPLEQSPIVVFGDEGGVHIVAENFKQLMHLLTYDEEISVNWASAYFYRDEDNYEESESLETYVRWLKILYDMEPVIEREETEKIIKTAQDKYTEKFNAWFSQYYNLDDAGIED